MQYLFKLFQGKLPLWMTFWVYGIIVSNGLSLLFQLSLPEGNGAEWYFFLFLGLLTLYNILVLIAIWRSAEHYRGAKRWKEGAKAFVFLSALMMGVNIYNVFFVSV